jgi:hypothetical protein
MFGSRSTEDDAVKQSVVFAGYPAFTGCENVAPLKGTAFRPYITAV